MPTPIPANSRSGCANAVVAYHKPYRTDHHQCDKHGGPEAVDARRLCVLGDAVSQNDVEYEQSAIGKGKQQAQGLAAELHLSQQPASRCRQDHCCDIAAAVYAYRGQYDRADKLYRSHGAQRQHRDRQVEADVHRPQHRTKCQQEPFLACR